MDSRVVHHHVFHAFWSFCFLTTRHTPSYCNSSETWHSSAWRCSRHCRNHAGLRLRCSSQAAGRGRVYGDASSGRCCGVGGSVVVFVQTAITKMLHKWGSIFELTASFSFGLFRAGSLFLFYLGQLFRDLNFREILIATDFFSPGERG